MAKIFIITGGNRGLGKSLVSLSLKLRDTIVVSLSRTLGEDQREWDQQRFQYIKVDLSEEFSRPLFKSIDKLLEGADSIYFINNASVILPIKKVGRLSDTEISNSLKVNVEFPLKLINLLMSDYAKKELLFVNISSGVALKPIAYWSLYGASKANMLNFFQTLELENKQNDKVRVYNIDPGVLDTRMQHEIRNSNFPTKNYFSLLETENKLISTEVAAQNIFKQIGLTI